MESDSEPANLATIWEIYSSLAATAILGQAPMFRPSMLTHRQNPHADPLGLGVLVLVSLLSLRMVPCIHALRVYMDEDIDIDVDADVDV